MSLELGAMLAGPISQKARQTEKKKSETTASKSVQQKIQ